MPDRWVVNASPVITLAKAGHLALLTALATDVLLPEVVVAEVLAGPVTDPARQAVEGGWGTRVAVPQVPVSVLEWGLGAGETAVLAVALAEGDCTAILDDAASRRCARTLGVPSMGTLGVVVRAKHQGRIASAAVVIEALRAAGLYVDEALMARVLRESVGGGLAALRRAAPWTHDPGCSAGLPGRAGASEAGGGARRHGRRTRPRGKKSKARSHGSLVTPRASLVGCTTV